MRFSPRSGVLVVKPDLFDEVFMSGMKVPDTVASFIPPQQGEVVAIGSDVAGVKVGDSVLFGLEVGVEFEGLVFLKQADIVCRVEA